MDHKFNEDTNKLRITDITAITTTTIIINYRKKWLKRREILCENRIRADPSIQTGKSGMEIRQNNGRITPVLVTVTG